MHRVKTNDPGLSYTRALVKAMFSLKKELPRRRFSKQEPANRGINLGTSTNQQTCNIKLKSEKKLMTNAKDFAMLNELDAALSQHSTPMEIASLDDATSLPT